MLSLNHSILPEGTEFGDFTVYSGHQVRGKNSVVDFMHAYWQGKHQNGHLPSRADIRPSDIVQHLDHLVILDIITKEGDDFSLVVRLIGTHVANFYGELTGKDIRDMDDKTAAKRIYQMCGLVLAENRPQLSATTALAPDREHLDAFALYLPLYDTNTVIDKILVSVDVRSSFRDHHG